MSFSFPKIYLASQSPRRAQLLEQIGVPFDLLLPEDMHAAELLGTVQKAVIERSGIDPAEVGQVVGGS